MEKRLSDEQIIKLFIAFGFWFDHEYDEKSFVYIGIYHSNANIDNALLGINFYKSLNFSTPDYVLHHPANGDGEESVELRTYSINNQEIENTFTLFEKNIFLPFLQNLNL